LAGDLLQFHHHEFGGFERREAYYDIDDTQINVIFGRGFPVAFNKVRFTRAAAMKGALAEQVLHKSTEIKPYLCLKRFIVWFEHHPLRAAKQAFFKE